LGEVTHAAIGPAVPGLAAKEQRHAQKNNVTLTGETMTWTKPEFEVVEVTMEVTAYVARR